MSSEGHEGTSTTPSLQELASRAQEIRELPSSLEGEELKRREHDRDLRDKYANWCMWIMIGQLALLNLLFIGVGVGCIKYTDWLFHAYLVGTLGEIVAIVIVIAKYLFPSAKL